MKRVALGVCLAVSLFLVALPRQAWGHGGFGGHGSFHGHGGFHGHVFGHGFGLHGFGFRGPRLVIGLGPAFWWGSAYAGPWYYPPYYGDPAFAPPVRSYWYYCQSARAYYPNVRACPEQWVQIPTSPE